MLHIICRSNNGMYLFKNDDDFARLKDIFLKHVPPSQLFIHHYVFMNTHFHLLAWSDCTSELPSLIKSITISYFHYYRRQHNYRGHLWHGRFKSKVVSTADQMRQCGRYIELNPVFARMCRSPHGHGWSSYHHYAYGKYDPLIQQMLYPGETALTKPGTDNLEYQEFIHAGIDLDYQDLKKQFDR